KPPFPTCSILVSVCRPHVHLIQRKPIATRLQTNQLLQSANTKVARDAAHEHHSMCLLLFSARVMTYEWALPCPRTRDPTRNHVSAHRQLVQFLRAARVDVLQRVEHSPASRQFQLLPASRLRKPSPAYRRRM